MEEALDPVEVGEAALGVDVAETEAVGQEREDLVVGLRLAERLDALLLEDDEPVVAGVGPRGAGPGGARPLPDVPALEVGARRQDDVGEPRLSLEPDRLVDHELDVALAVGPDVPVGLGHGADEGAAVLVVHAARLVPGRRVLVLLELRLDGRAAEALAPPLEMLVPHRLGDEEARDRLAFGRVLGIGRGSAVGPQAAGETKAAQGGRVAGDAALVVAREPEGGVAGRALRRGPDVDAGLAQALHGGQGDHRPRPLVAGGGAAGAAETALAAGGEHGLLGAPLPGQGPDLPGGDAALALRPLRRLGHVVGLAEDVVLPLVEADGAGGHVLLVVGALGEPRERDGEAEGHVGAQAGREPLVGEQARRCG